MRLIDADALIKDIAESIRLADEWEEESHEKKDKHGIKCAIDTRRSLLAMLSRVEEFPTSEPVKHGHWIKTPSPYHFKCSSCGVTANIKFHGVKDHKFCWHCGARMDGENE